MKKVLLYAFIFLTTPAVALWAQGYSFGNLTSPLVNNVVALTPATAGAHWTDKLVTAYGTAACVDGCTIEIPDSVADDGHATTPTLGQYVNLKFTGNGIFTSCILNAGTYSHIDLGSATLSLSGSNCIGINQTNSATFQTQRKFTVENGTINCNAQTGATGVFIGGATTHASVYMRATTITGCSDTTSTISTPTGGLVLVGTQFGNFDALHLYSNYVNLKLYSKSGQGGGNSNTFTALNSTDATVCALIATNAAPQMGPVLFINLTMTDCTVNGMAAIGQSSQQNQSLDVHLYGGTPEANATSGSASVTVDSMAITRSTMYASYASIYLNDTTIVEATANPWMILKNYSLAVLQNNNSYGVTGGVLVSPDATSHVSLNGEHDVSGNISNVTAYPSNISSTVGANHTWLTGTPVLNYTSTIPNQFTGNGQTPAFGDISGASSQATANDSLYGLVNTVTFAGSAGNVNTNRANFYQMQTTSGINDVLISVLVKSSANTTLRCGDDYTNGFSFGTQALVAGQWTRYIVFDGHTANATALTLLCYPADSAGATVSFTGLELLVIPTTTQGSSLVSQVLSGAVNPNTLGRVLTGTATLNFGSLVSIGCEDLTITVTGAATGDTVALGVPNGSVPSATFWYTGWVSSANTVTVRGCTLVSGDPASGTFRATVTQFQ